MNRKDPSKLVALDLVCLASVRRWCGKDERKEIKVGGFEFSSCCGQEENEETTRCEHYGGGSSNQVALDMAEEEVMGLGGVEMEMNGPTRCHGTCYILLENDIQAVKGTSFLVGHYPILFCGVNGTVALEFIVDLRPLKNLGLSGPKTYHSKLTMADNTQAKAMGEVRNMTIQIGTSGAVIDMGSGTLSIDDGVIRHTYFPKPRAKAYLENFEIDEEDH
ncbi:hypothetical protein Tco_0983192 [Tanacetum coccineum]